MALFTLPRYCNSLTVCALAQHAYAALIVWQFVPQVVALVTDRSAAVTERANRILARIYEKQFSFLNSKLMDGVKTSFAFQKQIFGSCNGLICLTNGFALTLYSSLYNTASS